jgi:DNA-binding transcriptional MerR regulator
MTGTEWTLEELIGRVAAVLDDTGYEGAPNGRVQDLPDARAVRWYTSIGLLDRPRQLGRTRTYGPRHYLQLVAVKRRQSQGFKIAEIQAELANAPDDVLQRIAQLPDVTTDPPRFWARPPAEYVPAAERHGEAPVDRVELITGVPLGGGAVLLLPASPDGGDIAHIREAARELMDVLAARGLIGTSSETNNAEASGTKRRGNAV